MAYHSFQIYEELIEKGHDPKEAAIETKFRSFDHALNLMKEDMNNMKKDILTIDHKIGNMKYWFIFIIVSIYLPMGKNLAIQAINHFVK